ncbi:polysaccharide biosynthesis tyrosine autokinase [Cocleimonas sp. KMM 6892]|uniref:GumC family protein n=1 Tax=unclassified Cocleimonas TaxID=2639732 RepID=UPI002DC00735|nr:MULTISPECIES: polysaccharide biosynthesis tyrosine autokinase [unclassified Cocleimonas]MEB8431797.1 polysaccharide biosynthesis tyrosine autokinase [Cocleimonas sp. KMM 6892]MEC4715117.1 polysaccharide biosynthesis tyrosine autokinase [Cocleimonas sp. KMM 6895]MEC4744069.1 polysaccharide biosynthesis tyrosine autokinase [Cocleimonas sp. KMM 6896]
MTSNNGQQLPMNPRSSRSNASDSDLIPYPRDFYPEELLEDSGGLDLKEFINVLKNHKKLILSIAFVTMLIALLLTLLMQPVYRAYSTIKVERYAANPNVQILNAEASRSDRDFFETQIQLIQTKTLASRVISELGLDKKPESTGLVSSIKNLFSGDKAADAKDTTAMEEIFLKNLTVTPVSNSQLLSISYDSSNPQLAADINNAIAKTFVRQNLERRFETASSYKTYVANNIEVTKKSLEEAEQRLNDYARENDIVQNVDGESTSSLTLKKQIDELVNAEKERIDAEAAYELYKSNPDSAPSFAINDPYILSLKKAAARLETQYQGLTRKKTRSANRLRKQIDDLKEQIASENKSIQSSFESRYMEAQQKEKMVRNQLDKLKAGALNLQSKSTKYNRLLREVEINQLAYNKQLEQLMAVNVASNVGTNNISIIDSASVPTKKFKPSLKTNLGFGLLLGLLLGMGFAFLREFVDDSVKNSELLEQATGLPVLSQLPETKNLGPKKLALQTALEPRSALAEAIRSLRTSLRFSTRHGAPQSTFITSSSAGEGKSTVALNLATAYAQAGSSVLLIDADLRNPSIHQLLELNNVEGLTNYLATTETKSGDVTQACMIKNLNVITSGPIPPDPVELLSGSKMAELIENASDIYDHIIIDGPPVLGLADSQVLGNLAEATIVTVEASKTRKTALLDSLKRLDRANANMIGTVLNRNSRSANPDYNQEYYSYTRQAPQTKKA